MKLYPVSIGGFWVWCGIKYWVSMGYEVEVDFVTPLVGLNGLYLSSLLSCYLGISYRSGNQPNLPD